MNGPFLEAHAEERGARPLLAADLAVAINETIAAWFGQHANGVQDQTRILGALGAVVTHQILQNPDHAVQNEVADCVLSKIVRALRREQTRSKLFGVKATLITKQ